ncbi:interferon-induced helicase C domain-containing protein 1 [Genypterus blacodes]|uniref:interferon-induced helicase C domain-containing protein 1 n=1 Tax=Genypterus blacodes TaxID=154954 RepID=UPI003F777997
MASDEDKQNVSLIDDLRPRLRQLIKIDQVLVFCHSIDAATKEAIRQKANNEGDRSAVDLLVNAVTKEPHSPGWFREFVDALNQGKCKFAADYVGGGLIDPKKEAENDYCVRFIEIMSPGLLEMKTTEVCNYCFAKEILTREDVENIKAKTTNESNMSGARMLLDRVVRNRPGWFSIFLDVLYETEHKPLYKELTGCLDLSEQDSEEKLCSIQTEEPMEFEVTTREEPDGKQNWATPESQPMDIYSAAESSGPSQPASLPDSQPAINLDRPETDAGSSAQGSRIADIVLRDYQKEVAGPALDGKNIIICLPTGSGKTRVAVYITKEHLDCRRGAERPGKVVVLVNKVPLVEQHYLSEFLPFLKNRYKVERVSGDSPLKISFTQTMKQNDVIVCTAQILENFLERSKKGDDEGVELHDLTLIIIDECHHTQKGGVYNHIMLRYLKQKHKNTRLKKELKETVPLPQILGLTASPGVGKATTMDKAEAHILKICANLDASRIMTSDKECKKEPSKCIAMIETREEDPFGEVIKDTMLAIQTHAGLSPTCELGSQNYEQWVVQQERNAAKDGDQKVRVCAEHLRRYNDGLVLSDTIRMRDALSVLDKFYEEESKKKVAPEGEAPIQTTDTEQFLFDLFKDNKDKLGKISQMPQHENKSLSQLRTTILKEFTGREQARGIIFTKTRLSAIALTQWSQENSKFEDVGVKVAFVIGAGDQSDVKPMTAAEQRDVLNKFRSGDVNLLIATTVAEEGLDIPKCNVVIRYGLVTNEIAMIQAKGRGRAEDSSYILVEVKGSGVTEKEMVNEYRTDMMHKAIAKIRGLSQEDYGKRIAEFQLLAIMEKQMKEKKKKKKQGMKKVNPSELSLSCRGCNKHVCSGEDIEIIADMHRVNFSKSFCELFIQRENSTLKERHVDYETNGFIACKDCGLRWGSMMFYQQLDCPSLHVKNFVVTLQGKKISKCNKWTDVPIQFSTFDFIGHASQEVQSSDEEDTE